MTKTDLYRAALRLLPAGKEKPVSSTGNGNGLPGRQERARRLAGLLRACRTVGASFAIFDEKGLMEHFVYGESNRGTAVVPGTFFRVASISKLLTGLCVLKLSEEGKVDIDGDVNGVLPFPVRHPGANGRSITLRMLMSHTAGIRDGKAYLAGIRHGLPVTAVLAGDSYAPQLPGEKWEYSNLGAGLVGSVLEAATAMPFEALMRRTLFEPLKAEGTFYPQRVRGSLADAFRVLPPGLRPKFDAGVRRSRPCPDADESAPEKHYLLAQGACCAPAETVAKALSTLMGGGFLGLTTRRYALEPVAPFGEAYPGMLQGIAISLFRDPTLGTRTVAGHQGHAYGAVHGAFFDPEAKCGMVFLSSGTSEARSGFLADVNLELLKFCRGEGYWPSTR